MQQPQIIINKTWGEHQAELREAELRKRLQNRGLLTLFLILVFAAVIVGLITTILHEYFSVKIETAFWIGFIVFLILWFVYAVRKGISAKIREMQNRRRFKRSSHRSSRYKKPRYKKKYSRKRRRR